MILDCRGYTTVSVTLYIVTLTFTCRSLPPSLPPSRSLCDNYLLELIDIAVVISTANHLKLPQKSPIDHRDKTTQSLFLFSLFYLFAQQFCQIEQHSQLQQNHLQTH